MAKTEPRNVRFAKRLKSIIGLSCRVSTIRNAMKQKNAPINRPMIDSDDQPAVLPSIKAQTRRRRAGLKVRTPRKSRRFACGSRDSGITMNVARIKATQAGTFTKKIQRQPSALVIQPPIIGPEVSEMPRQQPQHEKALA